MVKIVTESTADIPAEMARELNIAIVPSYVVFDTETYLDGVNLTRDQFYRKLEETHTIPTTATPPPAHYREVYERVAQETDEIVSIHLAARLSGLHDVAAVAAQDVPEARIVLVDSEQVSMGYGWLAIAAAEAAQRGETVKEIVRLVEGMRSRSRVLAALDTLEFIYRGGRVSWVQAMVGTVLRIKPLIEVYGAEVHLLERVRSRARAMERLVEHVEALGPLERAIVLHANAPERAAEVADRVQEFTPEWKPLITQAGVTIASHAGPGAVGLACVTKS